MKIKARYVVLVGVLAISLILNGIGVLWSAHLLRLRIDAKRSVESVICSDAGWINFDYDLKYADSCTRICSIGKASCSNLLYYVVSGSNGISCCLTCTHNLQQDSLGYRTCISFAANNIFAHWRYEESDRQCKKILFLCNSHPLIADDLGNGNIRCRDKVIESKIRSSQSSCAED